MAVPIRMLPILAGPTGREGAHLLFLPLLHGMAAQLRLRHPSERALLRKGR